MSCGFFFGCRVVKAFRVNHVKLCISFLPTKTFSLQSVVREFLTTSVALELVSKNNRCRFPITCKVEWAAKLKLKFWISGKGPHFEGVCRAMSMPGVFSNFSLLSKNLNLITYIINSPFLITGVQIILNHISHNWNGVGMAIRTRSVGVVRVARYRNFVLFGHIEIMGVKIVWWYFLLIFFVTLGLRCFPAGDLLS